jgi:hypothetical protein
VLYRRGHLVGGHGTGTARQRRAGLGEHADIADETGLDQRDSDARCLQVQPQRVGEPAESELRRGVQAGVRCGGLARH